MALNQAQQDYCREDLKDFLIRNSYVVAPGTENSIIDACVAEGLVFNSSGPFTSGRKIVGEQLMAILNKQLSNKDELSRELAMWASYCKQQQDYIRKELKDFFKRERLVGIGSATEDAIVAACEAEDVIFNWNRKNTAEWLSAILAKHKQLEVDPLKMDQLKQELAKWAKSCKEEEKQAGPEGLRLYTSQLAGILGRMRDGQAADNVWCEDEDIKTCLLDIIKAPEDVNQGGNYILTPVSLLDASFKHHIKTILAKSIPEPIHLSVPVAFNGHWRLAKVNLKQDKIQSAILWDSLENSTLQDHPAFHAFHESLKQAQAFGKESLANSKSNLEVEVKAEAANIQKNGYSCGDYVMKEALREMQALSHGLQAIHDAQEPEALRTAIIQQIKHNHHNKIKHNNKVSFFSKELPKYLEQAGNREKQAKFDNHMAQILQDLYKQNPHENDEEKLVNQAREQAYHELSDNLNLKLS